MIKVWEGVLYNSCSHRFSIRLFSVNGSVYHPYCEMSASLVRKSLEICDSSAGSLRKNGDKNLRKLQKLSRKDRSSTRVKSVAEAVKRMRSEGDKTEENIRKLELLGSLDIDSAIAKKIINRAVKPKEEEVKIEEPQGTVFTEEDFEKFEREYFVNA